MCRCEPRGELRARGRAGRGGHVSPLALALSLLLALVAAYGVAAAYAQRRRARALVAWLQRTHPEAYESLPEGMRRRPALVLVRHVRWQGLVTDSEFDARHRAVERMTRHIAASLLLALAVVGVMMATGALTRRPDAPLE